MQENKIASFFIVMASIVIVLAGFKSASQIIIPFLLSLFLAIILLPAFNYLNKKAIPESLSLVVVIGVFGVLVALVAKLIGSSIHDFNSNINFYAQQLGTYYKSLANFALTFGVQISKDEISAMINAKQIMSFATNILQNMGSMFSNGFVVLFSVIFMLLESKHFAQKIVLIGKNSDAVAHVENITSQIKEYMFLKAIMSLLTGLVVWITLLVIGTDYAFLWALVAFMFNFIPNIGSIIAAVPAVLLTLVQLGPLSALVVTVAYMVINIVIGSIIEPKVMGRGLGLSTLVVFVSLIFWGWLWGIVGMLLSIPLTIMVKIILDDNEDTRWLSVLLGSGETKDK